MSYFHNTGKRTNIVSLKPGDEKNYESLINQLTSLKKHYTTVQNIHDKNVEYIIDFAIDYLNESLEKRRIISEKPKTSKYFIVVEPQLVGSYYITKNESLESTHTFLGDLIKRSEFINNALLFKTRKEAEMFASGIRDKADYIAKFCEKNDYYPEGYDRKFWDIIISLKRVVYFGKRETIRDDSQISVCRADFISNGRIILFSSNNDMNSILEDEEE